jgi:hypothetical protein
MYKNDGTLLHTYLYALIAYNKSINMIYFNWYLPTLSHFPHGTLSKPIQHWLNCRGIGYLWIVFYG